MVALGLFVRLEAKPGKVADVAAFLQQGLKLANEETTTPLWFALRLGPTTFAIFDAFEDEAGRQTHLNGPIAKALMANAPNSARFASGHRAPRGTGCQDSGNGGRSHLTRRKIETLAHTASNALRSGRPWCAGAPDSPLSLHASHLTGVRALELRDVELLHLSIASMTRWAPGELSSLNSSSMSVGTTCHETP